MEEETDGALDQELISARHLLRAFYRAKIAAAQATGRRHEQKAMVAALRQERRFAFQELAQTFAQRRNARRMERKRRQSRLPEKSGVRPVYGLFSSSRHSLSQKNIQ